MQPANIAPKDRLIVPLDLPGVAQAEAMIAKLGDSVNFYKIGYQLAYAGGLPLVQQLSDRGKKVFLDLKLHDIGNTVAHRARLSADHEGGGRGARGIGVKNPRRHRADLL